MEKTKYEIMPNHIGTARFELTAIQKNIIYTIIGNLQNKMAMAIDENFLHQEHKIEIPMIKLAKSRNYKIIRDSLKNLASKTVEFEINVPKSGKSQQILTSIISGISYTEGDENLTFFVPSNSAIFFLFAGGGFTEFQKTIAISLNSIHAKSMYDFCCRWQDKGGYSCSVDSFRNLLNLGGKYAKINHLKEKVLDVAQAELLKKADFYFNYSLEKINSRKFNAISFKIFKNTDNTKATEIDPFAGFPEDHYIFVYKFLQYFFPNYIDGTAKSILDQLANLHNISKAYDRFTRLDKELTDGKKKKDDIKSLLIKIILPEFGVRHITNTLSL